MFLHTKGYMSKEELTKQLYWLVKECQTYPDLVEHLTPKILELKLKLKEFN
jgi:hypothetical protein